MFSQDYLVDLKTKLAEVNLKGDVKFFTENIYEVKNSFGELKKSNITSTRYVEYDKSGKIIYEYSENDRFLEEKTYNYNDKRLLSQYMYLKRDKGDNSKTIKLYIYKYNSNNKIEEILLKNDTSKDYSIFEKKIVYNYVNGKVSTIDEFNNNNEQIGRVKRTYIAENKYEDIEYEEDGDIKRITAYKNNLRVYSQEGNNIENHVYDSQKKLIKSGIKLNAPKGAKAVYDGQVVGNSHDIIITNKYNEKGDVTNFLQKYGEKTISEINCTEYKYDNKNNWTSRLKTFGSDVQLEEREFEYYSTAKTDTFSSTVKTLDMYRDYTTNLSNRDAIFQENAYSSGWEAFYGYVGKKIKYQILIPHNVIMYVGLIVDRNGYPRNIQIVEVPNGYTDKEKAANILNAIKEAKFLPAVKDGKFVRYQLIIPITRHSLTMPGDGLLEFFEKNKGKVIP